MSTARPEPWKRNARALSRFGALALAGGLARGDDLTSTIATLDLADLLDVTVVSASRNALPLSETAAAVTLIPGIDLVRTGTESLATGMRLAPGVQVAQINANRFAVSVRGFNNEFSNKLLVLKDGRSLYNPLFSGTYWDMQDALFEDLDRVEVVRGPGGASWGANAVNGVINILSKPAVETQGLRVESSVGSFLQAAGGLRYGDRLSEATHYRVYAKAVAHGESVNAAGQGLGDDWTRFQTGFRTDSALSDASALTVSGDFGYGDWLQYSSQQPQRFQGEDWNLLGRLRTELSEDSVLDLLAYYDAVRRYSTPNPVFSDRGHLEASHSLGLGERHHLQYGVNYEFTSARTESTAFHRYAEENRNLQVVGLFAEDQITVVPDRLRLIAGAKGEYFSLADWEFLPSAKLAWQVHEAHLLWGGAATGARTPDLTLNNLTLFVPGRVNFLSLPSPDIEAERVLTYELGWRGAVEGRLSWELVGFFSDYDPLHLTLQTFQPSPPTVVVETSDLRQGTAWGVESLVEWKAASWCRWRLQYTYFQIDLQDPASASPEQTTRDEGYAPRHEASLWWFLEPAPGLELASGWRYTGEVPAIGLEAYWGWDVRLAYRLGPGVEVAVAAHDLLDAQHPEWRRSPGFPQNSEIPRSVTATVTWHY